MQEVKYTHRHIQIPLQQGKTIYPKQDNRIHVDNLPFLPLPPPFLEADSCISSPRGFATAARAALRVMAGARPNEDTPRAPPREKASVGAVSAASANDTSTLRIPDVLEADSLTNHPDRTVGEATLPHIVCFEKYGGHLRKKNEKLCPFENFRYGLQEEVKPAGDNMEKDKRSHSSNK